MSRSEEPAGEELLLSDKVSIDRICLAFEDCWRNGDAPRMEVYLEGFDGRQRAALLRELLLVELAYLRDQGNEPTREQYASRFPDDSHVLSTVFMPAAVDRAPTYESGTRIGPYLIQRLLGSGSFGEVYLASSTQCQQPVALKVPAGDRFTSPDAAEHFLAEASTARKLDHPAIVRAWDVLRDDEGRPLIVMQFIDGQSLRQRLQQARWPTPAAISLLTQVAEGIDYAHRQGIIHRDLEPRNILLDREGRAYVSDFGLAVDEHTQEGRAGESAGSLAYMSPEQIRGESHWLDGRADIWALGVIMYEMLAGRRPFAARDVEQLASQILFRDAKPLRQIDGEIPAELERICLKCLNKAAADRYATAKDLADDLRRFQLAANRATAERGVSDPSPGSPLALTDSAASHSSPYALVLGGLLATVVLGVLVLGFGEPGRMHNTGANSMPLSIAATSTERRRPAESGQNDVPNGVTENSLVVENIELTVWVSQGSVDRRRGHISKIESSAAPLHFGDKIRLSVSVSEPAYIYVLWLDPDTQLRPIYPWEGGDWALRPSRELPRTRLALPAALSAWTIESGEAGAATVFVFAAREPLSKETRIGSTVTEFKPQTGEASDQVYWFQEGQEVRPPDRKSRAPDLSESTPLADPVLLNQQLVSHRMGRFFDSQAAICIPIDAD